MNSHKEQKVINSALWAAAGDAIGWISELTNLDGLIRRIDDNYLLKPVSWKRKVGGYSGVTVSLPAGTYSDDTQLRLAVSRCIRDNGEFDIESFAKIEIPVWLSYALGAGRASKAAATNLMRKDVTWFSNFYSANNSEYVNSGGNGTAMRIQPHVWSSKGLLERAYINSVVADSLVTHGHILAVCGAMLHADSLQFALVNNKAPDPTAIESMIDNFSSIVEVINQNYQLRNFWLPNWESLSQKKLEDEIESIKKETKDYLKKAVHANNKVSDSAECYKNAIRSLDCDKESRRGTATNTALASSLLCYYFSELSPYEAIITCVNELGTDTDSIASMAGAILGCYNEIPKWDIQDNDYIVKEAIRLSNISLGVKTQNFAYPNVNKWIPPQTQSDTLVIDEDGNYSVIGLGKVSAINSNSWNTKNHSWKWMIFDYGQTILIKSKLDDIKIVDSVKNNLIASVKNQSPKRAIEKTMEQSTFDYNIENDYPIHNNNNSLSLDDVTTSIIKNGFDEKEIGHYLIKFSEKNGLDSCVAFAAIIGKAYLARRKK
jgi:ADP-ribosylglycohydrolase